MTLRQRIRFYQQLAVLVRAGVPIRGSLTRLKERITGKEVTILSDQINAGERIGDAFTAAGFSPFECHLIIAAERGAQLDSVFEHLGDFWTRELEMRQALISPLYYPLVVMHLAVLLGALVELANSPWPEVVAHFLERMAILYAIGFTLYFTVRASWSNESMRRVWLLVPIVGKSLKTAYAYRWITAMRIEFSAGISLSRAVGDAWRASGYVGCEKFAVEGEQAMRAGTNLSTLVQGWTQLPRDWIDFIETGEISGALETAFKNLEEEAARAWKRAQQRMADWLPKIIYFFVLIIVAVQVGLLMYKVEIAPIVDAQEQIDKAVGN